MPMLEKNYLCGSCGFRFKLALLESESQCAIPCPGCGETAVEEITEDAGILLKSRGAECSGQCGSCGSCGECQDEGE